MKIILTLIATIFLVVRLGWSNESSPKISFPITQKNTKISSQSYLKYIKPQLKNMLSEFFDVLIMEEREFKRFIPVRKKMKVINMRIINLASYCSEEIIVCKAELARIAQEYQPLEAQLFQIEKSLTQIQKQSEEEKEEKNSSFKALWEVSQRSKTRKDIYHLSLDFTNIHNLISSLELNLRKKKFDKISYQKLKQESSDLVKKIDFAIWKMIPAEKQDIFKAVWANFFHKIEKHALASTKPQYFKKNLETLNFNWNLFHIQMAKGHLKTKKRVVSMIRQIHRRWNSILKLILG